MRRALVTGGNRGIGYAIAKGLKAAGVEVIIGARNATAGAQAAAELNVESLKLDVSDPRSVDHAVDAIGNLDILVNNAGVLGTGGVLDDRDEFQKSMAVMVQGPYDLIQAFGPAMVSQGYGRIVNVSSGWGSFAEGLGGPGSYGVAKAALNALTVASARALAPAVKVNAMCPGWVRTRMGGPGASLSPEEGADTAIWLATLSDDGPTGGFFRNRRPIPW